LGGSEENPENEMKKFRIKIDPKALSDIQNISDWYNQKREMHGKRFQFTTIKQINKIL